ncbi:MAG: hypothetical protein AAFP90_18000, partial [Planctomycetota bacterium]
MNRTSIIFLLAAITLAYLGSLRGVFHFDDYDAIVDNSDLRSMRIDRVWTTYGPSRPISALSIAATYGLFGLDRSA